MNALKDLSNTSLFHIFTFTQKPSKNMHWSFDSMLRCGQNSDKSPQYLRLNLYGRYIFFLTSALNVEWKFDVPNYSEL